MKTKLTCVLLSALLIYSCNSEPIPEEPQEPSTEEPEKPQEHEKPDRPQKPDVSKPVLGEEIGIYRFRLYQF